MDLKFPAGTTALVTGGTRGIGAAIVSTLAQENISRVHVVGVRQGAGLAELADRFPDTEFVSHTLDLSSPEERAELAAVLPDIDVLFNNAGAIPQGAIDSAELSTWRRSWDLKVWGYVDVTRMALGHMRERESGVIINVIGVSGERHDYDYLAGSMANSALMAMTRTIGATSLDWGVRVVGINPGVVLTDRLMDAIRVRAGMRFGDEDRWGEMVSSYPGQRMATPEEIADTAVFVASPRSSYTSGCIVTVDGGAAWRGTVI